jgi:hypothetical protein
MGDLLRNRWVVANSEVIFQAMRSLPLKSLEKVLTQIDHL